MTRLRLEALLVLLALVALALGDGGAKLRSRRSGTRMSLPGRDRARFEVLGGSRRDRTVWLAGIRGIRVLLSGPLLLQEAERRHQDERLFGSRRGRAGVTAPIGQFGEPQMR